MKALVWDGPGQLHVDDLPEPSPQSGEVVVRTGAVGVCGSEVEGYLGRQPNRVPPLVMGHELAGEVVEVGDGAALSWLGKVVAVNPIVACGHCAYCARGERNLCRRKGLVGIARPGGFAELVAVPAANLVALPAGTDPRLGAFIEPMANGVHAARLGLGGDREAKVVLIGAGAIGLCTLHALRSLGAGHIDVVEPGEHRRALAGRSGADRVHQDAASAREALGVGDKPRAAEGIGADVVVDAVGSALTRQLAVDLARPQGRVVLVGLHDDETTIAFRAVVRDEVTLLGSYAYSDADFAYATEMVTSGGAGPGELEPSFALEDGPLVFERLAAGALAPVRAFLGRG